MTPIIRWIGTKAVEAANKIEEEVMITKDREMVVIAEIATKEGEVVDREEEAIAMIEAATREVVAKVEASVTGPKMLKSEPTAAYPFRPTSSE